MARAHLTARQRRSADIRGLADAIVLRATGRVREELPLPLFERCPRCGVDLEPARNDYCPSCHRSFND